MTLQTTKTIKTFEKGIAFTNKCNRRETGAVPTLEEHIKCEK